MEIVLIKSCFLYYIHAPHQRFTATSRCSTPIVLQDLDAQHLLQEQHHAQLRPKCQNQVGVILAHILGSRRALDVYEPAGTARAPLSPAIRPPSAATAPPSLVLLWIAAQRTFQSSAQRFRPSALTQMAPGHRESRRARHTVT